MKTCQTNDLKSAFFHFLAWFFVFLLATVSSAAASFGDATADQTITPSEPATAPNIVLIYADDVDCESIFGTFPEQNSDSIQFPNLKKLAKAGIRFSNFHVTTPVCGPSRACLYSGQYAHHNRCRVNDSNSIRSLGFTGGFETFDPENELSIWMKRAGYTTAHVGKYLHEGFRPDYTIGIKWRNIVPPGWDYFEASLGSRYFGYSTYSKTSDTIIRETAEGYRTDNEIDEALKIVDAHLSSEDSHRPLFLSWCPIAAHIPGDRSEMRVESHRGKYADSFPSRMKQRLQDDARNRVDEMKFLAIPDRQKINVRIKAWQNRMCALLALDENIGRLRDELECRGMLANTIFIFTSDHGFRYFQHRHMGKRLPYDRITRVPFILSGPNVPADVQCSTLLANIDIAPTLVTLAGASTPSTCDGVSFAKLIADPSEPIRRDAIIIENWGQAVSQRSSVVATYSCMRTADTVYTEWATGGLEFYNLKTDPEQRNNRYPELDEATQKQLARKLKLLRASDAPPILANMSIKQKRICGTIEPAVLSGYAESSAGVASVSIELRCCDTDRYWNGIGWSNDRVSIPAKLDQYGGIISRWRYILDSKSFAMDPANDRSTRKVSLNVYGTDLDQQKMELIDAAEFELVFDAPETSIAGITKGTEFSIAGNASHMTEVKSVRVSIKNTRTEKYWNGSQWQQNIHSFEPDLVAKPSESGIRNYQWEVHAKLPGAAEKITVIARAYGPNGRFDLTPAIKTVIIE